MPQLDRRRFLTALAATTLAGVGMARLVVDDPARTRAELARGVSPLAAPAPAPIVLPPPAPSARIALPGGALMEIPGNSDLLAITLDDGVDSDVVRLYIQFAHDTGVRLTFFVNGRYASWTDNIAALHPLVESGQIQLANHTWAHPDLTTLPKDRIAEELRRNHQFLWTSYGIDARPYYRPPYGKHNATVDSVATDLGYSAATLWSGSLKDENVIAEDSIVRNAEMYFTPQTIVIGHLNHPPVTHVYPRLVEIIQSRSLRTVTLNDVFLKPYSRD